MTIDTFGAAVCAILVYDLYQRTKRMFSKPKEHTPMSFKIDLGAKVTDKITGYTGMVIARTEWLYSCKRYVIQAREMKDGKPVDNICCDEDQLEVLEEPATKHVMRNTGGPMPAPTRNADPKR